MSNDDERIARDVGEWVGEDIRAGLAHFQRSDFEGRLQQRLDGKETVPSWRRWLLAAGAASALATVVIVAAFLQRPATPMVTGREAIRSFFAEHTFLLRIQPAENVITSPVRSIRLPGVEEKHLSREEMTELFRNALPARDLNLSGLEIPDAGTAAPRELSQTIDRFFSITLKSIKEKT
jgi:hypothetical protein